MRFLKWREGKGERYKGGIAPLPHCPVCGSQRTRQSYVLLLTCCLLWGIKVSHWPRTHQLG